MILSDIRFNDYEDGDKIAATAGTAFRPPIDVCIARVTPRGDLLGGVLLTNWTGFGGSVQMHVASWALRWGSRAILWVAFDYPFNQLKVRKIFGYTPESNKHAIAFNEHLGFKRELLIKDAMPDGDIVLMSMYRADCRFLDLTPRKSRGEANGQS